MQNWDEQATINNNNSSNVIFIQCYGPQLSRQACCTVSMGVDAWTMLRCLCVSALVYVCGGLRKVINFKYFNFVHNNKQADKQQQQ